MTHGGHHELARIAAEQSAVLLKNEDNILPLKEGQKIRRSRRTGKDMRYQGRGRVISARPGWSTPPMFWKAPKCGRSEMWGDLPGLPGIRGRGVRQGNEIPPEEVLIRRQRRSQMAKTMRYQGAGSSHVNPTKLIHPADVLEKHRKCGRSGCGGGLHRTAPEYEGEGFDRDHMKMPPEK